MDIPSVLRWILIALLGLTLVAYWQLIPAVLAGEPLLALVAAAHLTLLLVALFTLVTGRPWGFFILYLLIPFSTILLSISFVPFLPLLFPPPLRPMAVTLINGMVLLIVVATHLQQPRQH